MPFPVTPGYCFTENLLINGNALDDPNVGWTITKNGGTGWNAIRDGDSDQFMFVTSKRECEKHQDIDLTEYITAEREYPEIAFSESYKKLGPQNDVYRVGATLYDFNGFVRDSGEENHQNVSNEEWNHVNFYFEQYGPGVRIVQIQHMGQDGEHYSGYYGTAITNSQLMVRVGCSPWVFPYTIEFKTTSYFSENCQEPVERVTLDYYDMEYCQDTYFGHCESVDPPTIKFWFYENCPDNCACVPTSTQVHEGHNNCHPHPTKEGQSIRYEWKSDDYCTEAQGLPPDIPAPTASPPSMSPTYSYYWVAWHVIARSSECSRGHVLIAGDYSSVTVCARDVLMIPSLCSTGTLMFSEETGTCRCCTSTDPQWDQQGTNPTWDVIKMDSRENLYFNPNDTMNSYDVVPGRKCIPNSLPRGLNAVFDTSICTDGHFVSHEHLGVNVPIAHIDGCDIYNVTLYECEEFYEVKTVAPALAISIVSLGVFFGIFCFACYWCGGRVTAFVDEKLFGPKRKRLREVNPKTISESSYI